MDAASVREASRPSAPRARTRGAEGAAAESPSSAVAGART
jgi:hypothetical protein